MASWNELPAREDGDENAWNEHRAESPDVEYADEDEAGQLGLGVPGEQRAIPTLAKTSGVEAFLEAVRELGGEIVAAGPMDGQTELVKPAPAGLGIPPEYRIPREYR